MSIPRRLVLLAVLLIPACALQRAGPIRPLTPGDWAARRTELLARRDWDAHGRIAVRGERGGGQGDLQWEQRGDETRLRVNGPFGAGAYELRWTPHEVTIRGRGGDFSRTYEGPDAMNEFLAGQLGWPFPAASVRYWLLGVPDPGAPPAEERFDARGQLKSIEQAGWSVAYEQFTGTGGAWLPARVTLEGAGARVRLAVDRWELR